MEALSCPLHRWGACGFVKLHSEAQSWAFGSGVKTHSFTFTTLPPVKGQNTVQCVICPSLLSGTWILYIIEGARAQSMTERASPKGWSPSGVQELDSTPQWRTGGVCGHLQPTTLSDLRCLPIGPQRPIPMDGISARIAELTRGPAGNTVATCWY